MTLSEYFDPYNDEHIKAYYHLIIEGVFPNSFTQEIKDNNIEINPPWHELIQFKMTRCWVYYRMELIKCKLEELNSSPQLQV